MNIDKSKLTPGSYIVNASGDLEENLNDPAMKARKVKAEENNAKAVEDNDVKGTKAKGTKFAKLNTTNDSAANTGEAE